jgi:hypothetical protein
LFRGQEPHPELVLSSASPNGLRISRRKRAAQDDLKSNDSHAETRMVQPLLGMAQIVLRILITIWTFELKWWIIDYRVPSALLHFESTQRG